MGKKINNTLDTAEVREVLRHGSMSENDAKSRMNTYRKVMSNHNDRGEVNDAVRRVFTGLGYGSADLKGTTQHDISIIANVRSFAGFMAIERSLTQPNEYISFMDVTGRYSDKVIDPNLGVADYSGVTEQRDLKSEETIEASTETTIDTKEVIIPRSLRMTLKSSSKEYIVGDDGKGTLIAAPGVLITGTIDYATGVIKFTPFAAVDSYEGSYVVDLPANSSVKDDNVLTYKMGGTLMRTVPKLIMSQVSLSTAAAMGRSMGLDPKEYMSDQMKVAYLMSINSRLVKEMMQTAVDSKTIGIDFNEVTYDAFVSYADWFTAKFTDIDYALAMQAFKGVRATCYLVAPDVAATITKTEVRNNFVHNKEYDYINDYIGDFRGVPVLQHVDVEPGTGYAIHKRPNGEAAPVARGIFLGLTDTPEVGNFNNTTQLAQGIYSQEAVKGIFPELVIKFKVDGTMGQGA